MSYTEWLGYNSENTKSMVGLRCAQNFAALGEKQHAKQSSKQADIRKLPFSQNTFKSICQKFRVHSSITKAITRSASPSFTCEKVIMNQAAYGTIVSRHLASQHLTNATPSVQLSHLKRVAIRYGALCDLISRKRINLCHPLWLRTRYREILTAKSQQC